MTRYTVLVSLLTLAASSALAQDNPTREMEGCYHWQRWDVGGDFVDVGRTCWRDDGTPKVPGTTADALRSAPPSTWGRWEPHANACYSWQSFRFDNLDTPVDSGLMCWDAEGKLKESHVWQANLLNPATCGRLVIPTGQLPSSVFTFEGGGDVTCGRINGNQVVCGCKAPAPAPAAPAR